jgi:hypothetical protein
MNKNSPFCNYQLQNNRWICSKCNNVVEISQDSAKPITSCSKNYKAVEFNDNKHLRLIDITTYDLDLISVSETIGVGTEFKKILRRFKLLPQLTYNYNQKFMMMNNWGPDICDDKKRTLIVNWLIEEAVKLNMQYDEKHINLLLTKAINNLRKKVNSSSHL